MYSLLSDPARRKVDFFPAARLDAARPSLPSGQLDRVTSEKNYTVFRADPTRRELTVTFVGAHGEICERTCNA